MTFSPKLIFWVTFIVMVGQGVTSGTVHLIGVVPDKYLPAVTGWLGLIVFVALMFLTLATGRASVGAGPLAPPPTVPEANAILTEAKKAASTSLILIGCLAVLALLLAPPASAQAPEGCRPYTTPTQCVAELSFRLQLAANEARGVPQHGSWDSPPAKAAVAAAPVPPTFSAKEAIVAGRKVTPKQAGADPVGTLQGIIASAVMQDVEAALADAQAQVPPDAIGAACWTAIDTFVKSNPSLNPLPQGLGAAQALQKARDIEAFAAAVASPNGPLAPLKIGCAPMLLDTVTNLAALGITGLGGVNFIVGLGSVLGVVVP